MAKNVSQYAGWNSYTLQCVMWLWNRDSEFTKWHHPAMWYVALGWNAIEFAQTPAILELYIWFPFPHVTAVGLIGSGVRVSVSYQQKYQPCSVLRSTAAETDGVMTMRDVSGPSGGGVELRLRRITSNPSQTLRRRLVPVWNSSKPLIIIYKWTSHGQIILTCTLSRSDETNCRFLTRNLSMFFFTELN